jgi:tetratricopeptide (TPR) repeat protein
MANWEKADANTLIIACAALLNHADELKKLDQAGGEGKLPAEEVERKKKEVLGTVGEAERIAQQALVKTQQELATDANLSPNQKSAKTGEITTLLSLLGGHYLGSKRYEEAMQAYTQVLALNPGNVVALNNRAMIMAGTKTNLPEALTQIDSAIQRVGPLPLIVDSKAMVLYAAGKYVEALEAAQQVIAEVPDQLDPVRNPGLAKNWGGYYFHLALMLDANQKPSDAAEAMKKARELGFGEADVSDLERGLWKEMAAK